MVKVKDKRVFSSYIKILESSPIIQIHRTKKKDSKWVDIGFMRDYN